MALATASLINGIFEPHDDYSKLLAGAHRRRVTPLGAPALVRHIAFWNPDAASPAAAEREVAEGRSRSTRSTDGDPTDSEPESIAQRAKAADQCIAAVYRGLQARTCGQDREGPISNVRANGRIESGRKWFTVLFHGVMADERGADDCPADVIPDSYRAIKISFLWHGIDTTLSFELHTEFVGLTIVLDASKYKTADELKLAKTTQGCVFNEIYERLNDFTRIKSVPLDDRPALHKFIYHTVWTRFEDEVLRPMGKIAPGPMFVDFRGLVLGAKKVNRRVHVAAPFERIGARKGTGGERPPVCAKINCFEGLWDFMTETHPEDTELTLSRFLDDRAFYATALGSQAQLLTEGKSKPLYYLLYEDTLNQWQLGRLVYRVHRAGTARIAAIMHFDKLRRANQTVTEVERVLENALAALKTKDGAALTARASTDGDAAGTDGDTDGEDDTFSESEERAENKVRLFIRHRYEEVEQRLGSIAEGLDGTLDFRIERSRYYVSQFSGVAQALRIKRVRGFQQYDEFVIQRLGPVFEYIDSLGRRYERVQKSRSLLLERIQTLDSNHQERLISQAQRVADVALSSVLGPYYVANIASHALVDIVDDKLVWLSAVFFGSVMAVLLMYAKSWPKGATFRQRRWIQFVIALVVAIGVTAAIDHRDELSKRAGLVGGAVGLAVIASPPH